jgi:hypothetical protein
MGCEAFVNYSYRIYVMISAVVNAHCLAINV